MNDDRIRGLTIEQWMQRWHDERNTHHIMHLCNDLIIMLDGQGCEHDRSNLCQKGGCNPITGFPMQCPACKAGLLHLEFITNHQVLIVCDHCLTEVRRDYPS